MTKCYLSKTVSVIILPMDLYLIRHGETQENADGVIQGWLDTELNANGRRQAQEAAQAFDEPIEAIYASDLRRATQTAHAFRQKYPNLPYAEDACLRERDFGEANGQKRDNYDWEVFWASSDTVSIPGAETLDAFSHRVQLFLDMLRQTGYSRVLIITHGGTINRIQDLLSRHDAHTHVQHRNTSLTHVVLK